VTTLVLASPFKVNVRCNNKNQLFIFINFNLHHSFAISSQLQHEKGQTMQQTIANKAMQSFNKRYKAQKNDNLNKKDDHKDIGFIL
jgi:hypothetical protein